MTDAPALLQRRFQLAEHTRSIYFATVEQHIKPDDVLKPDFWQHVASGLRPYDEIIVATDSCEWRLSLLVADVWHCGARVVELGRHDMTGQEEDDHSAGDDLRVKWRGPVNKWCVVRTSDGVALKAGLESKGVALENLAVVAQERAAIGN